MEDSGDVPSTTVRLPRTSIAAAAVLFGCSGTIATLAPAGTAPATLGVWRVVVGSMGLVAMARFRYVDLVALRRKLGWLLVGGGAVAVSQLAFFEAVHRVGVATGTAITIATGPVAAAIIAFTFDHVRPTRSWLAGVCVAAAGVFVLTGGVGTNVIGVTLAIVSGATFPLYGRAARSIMSVVTSSRAISAVFAVGAIMLTVASPHAIGGMLHSSSIGVALPLGLATVAIAYPMWARGLGVLDLGTVAAITLLEPVAAAVLAVAVVGEPLSKPLVVGVASIVMGIALSSRGPRRSRSRGRARPEAPAVYEIDLVSFASTHSPDDTG
jgi:DME family drug/metabolite transporter